MNAIAWRLFAAEHRDHFGVHRRPHRALAAILQRVVTPLRRVSLVLRRRVTLEQSLWVLIAALLIGFIVVLIMGATGVGRGGR